MTISAGPASTRPARNLRMPKACPGVDAHQDLEFASVGPGSGCADTRATAEPLQLSGTSAFPVPASSTTLLPRPLLEHLGWSSLSTLTHRLQTPFPHEKQPELNCRLGSVHPPRVSPHLHEALQLIELAVQIFKVLFEKFPESIIKHDFDQNTESLLLRHL